MNKDSRMLEEAYTLINFRQVVTESALDPIIDELKSQGKKIYELDGGVELPYWNDLQEYIIQKYGKIKGHANIFLLKNMMKLIFKSAGKDVDEYFNAKSQVSEGLRDVAKIAAPAVMAITVGLGTMLGALKDINNFESKIPQVEQQEPQQAKDYKETVKKMRDSFMFKDSDMALMNYMQNRSKANKILQSSPKSLSK
jgi:hypothetical protein